jgi:hypothetical protein
MTDQTLSYTTPDPEWVQVQYNQNSFMRYCSQLSQFSQAFPIPVLVGTPTELRAIFNDLKRMVPRTEPVGLSISEKATPGYDGATSKVRIYSPNRQSPKKTTII